MDNVESSTVLVTEQVKRSQKLLTAIGLGKPICSPEWIHASKKANEFLGMIQTQAITFINRCVIINFFRSVGFYIAGRTSGIEVGLLVEGVFNTCQQRKVVK